MKKKSGFTLTELIAVIVILGLLVAIAVPVYFNVTKKAKENEYEAKKAYIATVATRYAEENNVNITNAFSVARLIASGYMSAEDYIDSDSSQIPFIANPTNANDNLACHTISITVDNYEYSATVNDDSDCSLISGDEDAKDFGIKAYKLEDNSIKSEISFENSNTLNWVNTDVILLIKPNYSNILESIISYNGESKEINFNDSSICSSVKMDCPNVVILRATAILKTEVSISLKLTQNDNETKLLTTRVEVRIDKEVPTVNFEKYDGWTDANKDTLIYVSDGSGSGPKGVYVTDNQVMPNKECTEANRCYKIDDNKISGAVAVPNLTDKQYYLWGIDNVDNISSEYVLFDVNNVDNVAPTCTVEGENTTWKTGSITIKWGCRDSESGCKTGYDGSSKVYTETAKQITIPSYVIKDNVGNETNCPSKNVNAYIDNDPPTCTNTPSFSDWTREDRTITWGCSDNGSGCDPSSGGGSKIINTTMEKYTIPSYVIKDNVGNETNCPSVTIDVKVEKKPLDTTPPTCTHTSNFSNWTNQNRTITWGCSDSDSGCDSRYSGGSKIINTSMEKYTIPSYEIRDNDGNITRCPAVSVDVKVDKNPPTCGNATGGKTYWTKNQSVSIGVNCSDTGSGCQYSNFTSSISGNGTTQYTGITIRDNAGNTTTCYNTYNKYIDTIAPSCGSATGGKTYWTKDQSVSVGVNCSDTGSGCKYSNFTSSISGHGRTSYIGITIKDNVGNTATCYNTYNKYIDTVPPSCTTTGGETNATSNLTIRGTCSDSDSGCLYSSVATTVYTSTSYNPGWSSPGTVYDNVNNYTTCPSTYYSFKESCAYTAGKSWSITIDNNFVIPCSGSYTIKLWGGAGGSDDESPGGKGAYIKVTAKLKKNSVAAFIIGGEGGSSTWQEKMNAGGHNGGGNAYWSGAGGGRTEVSIDGTLAAAAAGGGGGTFHLGQAGGGRVSTKSGNTTSSWKGGSTNTYVAYDCNADAGGGGAGYKRGGKRGIYEECSGASTGYGGISGYESSLVTKVEEKASNKSGNGKAEIILDSIDSSSIGEEIIIEDDGNGEEILFEDAG